MHTGVSPSDVSRGRHRCGGAAGPRPSRRGGRLVCIVLSVEMVGSVILSGLLGPARFAQITGWDRTVHAWKDMGKQVATARRRPRPACLRSDDIRPDLTYPELVRLLGGDGARLLDRGWRAAPRRHPEITYRWSFTDGSDLTATFEGGRLVIYSVSEPGEG
jgi:hypothetical protein